MSAQTLTDAGIYVNQFDLSPYAARINESVSVASPDMNNLAGGGYQHLLGGIASAALDIGGILDYATPGSFAAFSGAIRGRQDVVTIVPNTITAAAGSPAFMFRGILADYAAPQGSIGDTARYAGRWRGDTGLVAGVVGATLTSRSGPLTGTSLQLGAVATASNGVPERLWASLHITATTGTNLAVTIQSDNATGFPSPATAATFATVSAVGAQFLTIPGPLTDDWFRVNATIGTGFFTFLVLIGVY